MPTLSPRYKVFKAEVKRLANALLPDWEVFTAQKDLTKNGWDGCVNFDVETHTATVILNTKLDKDWPLDYIKRIATHEILHVVLADLTHVAETTINIKLIGKLEHMIINRLTGFICD